jgi:type I restriction enzyme R subunit
MVDTSEKNFEATIEQSLLANGYHKCDPKDYERSLCLIPNDVFDFIYATQPQEWEKFQQQYGEEAKQKLLQRLVQQVRDRGTLEVLRKGIKANGCTFKLAYFRPVSGLNEELQKLYKANFFTVVRQLKYSQKNENSLDLGIFLNGLPISTAELKNPLKGQTVEDAIKQYRRDREEREPLFAIGRCLSHFAVDPDFVYFTTHLQGLKTEFLPFNQGRNYGAGNPPAAFGFATAYLWEQIWSPDSVLDLIQNFAQLVEEEDYKGRKTGKKSVIFPRYHQLDAVRRLVTDACDKGTGQRYLIQHSAGSGKSKSISWLAHQLATLHGVDDRRIFDSIIVISDRRQLDSQLQRDVRQFAQIVGVVENIDQTSRQLKQALEEGKNIIVTTLQKFSVIVDQIGQLSGNRFAVIVDEAHSSQTGESAKKLKAVLSVTSLEAAEQEDAGEEEDLEDRIVAEAKKRGRLPNLSYFAFTATPKPKTLELFGTSQPDGKYAPFSLYTMRQAIEEKFILDVLNNYTTYKTYFSLLKTIESDPRYNRAKANSLLRWFVDLHEHAIERKVAIMVEHFGEHVAHQISGKAKAMIVTRSRLHAVRYKLAVDQYLKDKGYLYKTLVAFTGKVTDSGIEYTETGMNTAATGKSIPEKATAETFKQDEYRFLIVANKFQTGFDQPLLHTMYVDKKLGGVNAVQTLSRLNRMHPGKEDTMVLDFANEAEDIQKAFEDYYDRTILSEGTDPNLLYDLQTQLEDFDFYDSSDLDRFAAIYFAPNATQDKIHAALDPVVERYTQAIAEEQFDFRGKLKDYERLYAFLSQVIIFADSDLEKFYEFARHLSRKLPVSRERLPAEIQQHIELDSYRIQQTSSGRIKLERGAKELDPIGPKGASMPTSEDLEPLSQIIQQLNQRFGTDFSDDDKVFIEQLETKLDNSDTLKASIRVNSPENAQLTFNNVVNDQMQEMVETNFKFYKQVNDDPDFAQALLNWLFQRYLERANGQTNDEAESA